MNSEGLEWTVMTWNIQGTKRTDLDRIADVIRSESPDVVALQEVRRPQAAKLASKLTMSAAWADKHFIFKPLFPGRAEGAAILTPHDLSTTGNTTISSFTSKRSYRRRIVQWATVQRSDASAYRLYNAHLSPHDLSDERIGEATKIAELARSHGDAPPVIVAGDLNDQGEPAIIAMLPGIEHVPAPLTNPASAPHQALDHVLLPVEARSVATTVPAGGDQWTDVSDHLPVTVRFTLDWVQGGIAS